jgi:hypothetical protein
MLEEHFPRFFPLSGLEKLADPPDPAYFAPGR